jgi:hypothetical protein
MGSPALHYPIFGVTGLPCVTLRAGGGGGDQARHRAVPAVAVAHLPEVSQERWVALQSPPARSAGVQPSALCTRCLSWVAGWSTMPTPPCRCVTVRVQVACFHVHGCRCFLASLCCLNYPPFPFHRPFEPQERIITTLVRADRPTLAAVAGSGAGSGAGSSAGSGAGAGAGTGGGSIGDVPLVRLDQVPKEALLSDMRALVKQFADTVKVMAMVMAANTRLHRSHELTPSHARAHCLFAPPSPSPLTHAPPTTYVLCDVRCRGRSPPLTLTSWPSSAS